MDASARFSSRVIDQMISDIDEADGNEVFWVGRIDDEGIVVSAEVGSRGNEDSVIINENLAREGHVLIHNHPSGNIHPSDADQNIAYHSQDSSLGFYIVNNSVSEVYVVVEPIKAPKIEMILRDEAAFYLTREGPLASKSENYEERPSQIQLTKEIMSAFNRNRVSVFEAGTGVGKSFAYLIPSILWSVKNRERVVISTGTINLQQQIFEKDIPLALKITDKKIKAVLVKGRQNYVCLRRLTDCEDSRDLFSEDTEILDKISEWTKTSSSGSRSDLSFNPPDSVWTKVNSESDACLGGRCPFREKCFVMKVRKEASDANLLVVNHHLLFADIESRMSGTGYEDTAVLPPYKRVVFDEAHGIEESATSFFSERFSRFSIMKQVNLLFRQWKLNYTGFLIQSSVVSKSENVIERALESYNDIKDSLSALDQIVIFMMDEESTMRIHNENSMRFTDVLKSIDDLKTAITRFVNLCQEVIDGIDDEDKDIPCVWECKNVLRRVESYAALCNSFCHWDKSPDCVFWMQKKRLPPKVPGDEFLLFSEFTKTPLEISGKMNAGVFEPLETVVCTSATLRTDGNFGYWSHRVGVNFVDEERLSMMAFDSPFPYDKNVILAVPNDAPFPDSQYFQPYVENTLPKLIEAARGRTLVLFTSYDSLKYSYNSCVSAMESQGIMMFKQGDDDRFRLLQKFKENTSSVLFATDSFWEGVDVPGESLSQVIIIKLPFAVPNDPVFAARSQALEKKGGNSFMQLSVPQAVIKFRQGFGRLVRRGDDRGVVVVLDRRIVEKRYGSIFTNSIPKTRRMYSPMSSIIETVRNFIVNN